MARLLAKLLAPLIAIVTLLAFPAISFAFTNNLSTELDQVNSNGCNGRWYVAPTMHNDYQTFTPTKNRVDAIGVVLNTTGGSAPVEVQLWTGNGATKLGDATLTVNYKAPPGPGIVTGDWYYYDIVPDATITAGVTYRVVVTSTSNTAYWLTSTGPPDPYTGGQAYVDGSAQANQDFCFATYDYNAAAPPPPTPTPTPTPTNSQTPAGGTTTQTTTSTPKGNTDATTTKPATKSASKSATKAAAPIAVETKGSSSNLLVWLAGLVILILLGLIVLFLLMKRKTGKDKPATTNSASTQPPAPPVSSPPVENPPSANPPAS